MRLPALKLFLTAGAGKDAHNLSRRKKRRKCEIECLPKSLKGAQKVLRERKKERQPAKREGKPEGSRYHTQRGKERKLLFARVTALL